MMTIKKTRNLILILGDQLTLDISALSELDNKQDVVLMMEVMNEATYVKHHPVKIAFIFSAMRHFASVLRDKNIPVLYIKIDETENKQSFTENLYSVVNKIRPSKITITEPGEYRISEMIQMWRQQVDIPITVLNDNRFLCKISEFRDWAKGKNHLRLDQFYQWMRKKTGILMQNSKPIGGRFSFDQENRKPPKKEMHFLNPPLPEEDAITKDVIDFVRKNFSHHLGYLKEFNLAVTRIDALKQLDFFIKNNLPHFGDFQDAMLLNEYYLYHSNLSMYLNVGLLTAQEVVKSAENAYFQGYVSINNAEGFIRQILGWREFVRGVYWVKMPGYKSLNFFFAQANLPAFYWTGETDMICLRHVITQTLETATSHHIQRLMVTGNFSMLLGVLPQQICDWYLAAYADAFEWVELPNTLGMSQFADGGYFATKPYAASGNYINKMSNFCKQCKYDVKQKLTESACPFNDLYWGFLIENRKHLENNHRMAISYKQIDKMTHAIQQAFLRKRKEIIQKLCEPSTVEDS